MIFSRDELLNAISRLDVDRRLNYDANLAGPGRGDNVFLLYVESGFDADNVFWSRFGLSYQTCTDLGYRYESEARRYSNNTNLKRRESLANTSYKIDVLHREKAKSSNAFRFDQQAVSSSDARQRRGGAGGGRAKHLPHLRSSSSRPPCSRSRRS